MTSTLFIEATGTRPSPHECHTVSESVGLLDQSSFAKYELSGPGARPLLDRLCANKLPVADGRMALTQMCTPRGGIECDVTITKLADDHYYVVSAAATELHDYDWIAQHLPEDDSVTLKNTSSAVGVLTLAGTRLKTTSAIRHLHRLFQKGLSLLSL